MPALVKNQYDSKHTLFILWNIGRPAEWEKLSLAQLLIRETSLVKGSLWMVLLRLEVSLVQREK